ncbi:Cytochrome b5 [Penicillium concentricum]|uniref:NADH-cytochrome b5 reductase 1 n=1 Tax=Penicillium concentricum TaxID=293559 RepID=A0A9W9SFM0_9EURO|nr:Cytochrome b5 [Penicillium concentricum]KAJ5375283.1 Cytochrome b5 [Penicillium concentricum]
MYTLEEVQRHNKPDDVWIILHNKVYDVTKYLEDHPGGSAILIEVAGTDATEAFEETGHSDEAREELVQYYVGDLPSEEHAESIEVYRPTFEQVAQTAVVSVKPSPSRIRSLALSLLKFGMTGALGGVAFAGYSNGWGQFAPILKKISESTSTVLSNHPTSSRQFWSGFGIASVAQLSITFGVTMWISSKLDVQQEFTHHLPHRTSRSDRLIFRKKVSSTAKKAPTKALPTSPLDPRQFKSFPLTHKEVVSPNVYRFTFGLPSTDDILGLPTGQHIALRAIINGKSVSRSYTPVSNNTDLGRIELLVKVYPQGQMTKHLEKMNIGDSIEIRGPKGAMQYTTSYANHIGMIAGGTGITPMYQLIRAICNDKADTTKMSLLYANNTEEDILLRRELDDFARENPHKFSVQYVLSQAGEDWTGHRGFVSQDLIQKYLAPADEDNKMLLCGPPPMINAMKKTLAGLGWKDPSAVSKATDQVFLF